MPNINQIRLQAILDRFGQMGGGTYDPNLNPVNDDESMNNSIPPNLRALGTQSDVAPDTEEPMPTYNPQTVASKRFADLLDQYPKEEGPTMGRAILAGGLAVGKQGSYKDSQDFLHEPQDRAVTNWKNSSEGAYKAAQLENTANATERSAVSNVISARVAADRLVAAEKKSQAEMASRERIAAQKTDIEREKMNGAKFNFDGEYVIVTRGDGTVYNSGVASTAFNPMERARLQAATQVQVANIGADSREKIADDKGWSQPVMIQDPNDPNKQISVQTHLGTGEVREVKMAGRNVGPITKPSAASKMIQPTNIKDIQTKTQETINLLGEIIDDKGNFTKNATAATGALHVLGTDRIPLTPGYSGAKSFERLKSMLVIELIGEMKNQSRTGATGFGQLSRAELQVLENSAGKLDRSQDPEVLRAELVRIREKLKKIMLPDDGSSPTVTQPRSKMDQDIDAA